MAYLPILLQIVLDVKDFVSQNLHSHTAMTSKDDLDISTCGMGKLK